MFLTLNMSKEGRRDGKARPHHYAFICALRAKITDLNNFGQFVHTFSVSKQHLT